MVLFGNINRKKEIKIKISKIKISNLFGIKEQNLDIQLKAESANGMDAIAVAVLKKSKNICESNFIEGMACTGGCINGPGCIIHKLQSEKQLESFSKTSSKSILQAASKLEE